MIKCLPHSSAPCWLRASSLSTHAVSWRSSPQSQAQPAPENLNPMSILCPKAPEELRKAFREAEARRLHPNQGPSDVAQQLAPALPRPGGEGVTQLGVEEVQHRIAQKGHTCDCDVLSGSERKKKSLSSCDVEVRETQGLHLDVEERQRKR